MLSSSILSKASLPGPFQNDSCGWQGAGLPWGVQEWCDLTPQALPELSPGPQMWPGTLVISHPILCGC